MKCAKCGKELSSGQIFCDACGAENRIVPDYDPIVEGDEFDDELQRKKTIKRKRSTRKKAMVIALLLIIVLTGVVFSGIYYRNSHSFDFQYGKALESYKSGEYSKAYTFAQKAVNLDGGSFDALTLLGIIEVYLEDYDSALASLESATSLDIEKVSDFELLDALKYLYYVYNETGNYDKLLKAAESNPDDAAVQSLLSKYLVPSPGVSLEAGEYDGPVHVELYSSNKKLKIYYTLDGSMPTESSDEYTDAIELVEGQITLTAVCFDESGRRSLYESRTYTLAAQPPSDPVVYPQSGTYNDEVYITVTVDDGCTAYYTFDGSTPTTSSTKYTGSFAMPEGNNIFSVIAVDENGLAGNVVTRTYTYLPQVEEDESIEVEE
ncbi:MAG: chitobiase/beta-hexosaminidase C-terminal domain-containing protein [Eubacterium sp.]|nr:chitobiase/beta-hexosaminidase C-terminal domain-containing protein [Eubacterium sp.]